MEDTFGILEHSRCKDCANRLSRVFTPFDLEDFGLTEAMIEEANDADEGDYDEGLVGVEVEQHICLVSKSDIEGTVTQCTKYLPMSKCNPLLVSDKVLLGN